MAHRWPTRLLLLLQCICQQVAVAPHALVRVAHPRRAVHHLPAHHAWGRWALQLLAVTLLGSHHGPVQATHHASLLHYACLLGRGVLLLLGAQ